MSTALLNVSVLKQRSRWSRSVEQLNESFDVELQVW